jgi:cellulose synthase/poly-beta-1,6-N-acetylglucosamine synthase-like glycosyltransferase
MTKTTTERAVRGGTVGSPTIMPDKDENVLAIPPDFKLSVLMPVYNERKIILKVIARAQAVAIPKEIIVDDGSTNDTCDILRQEVVRKWENV